MSVEVWHLQMCTYYSPQFQLNIFLQPIFLNSLREIKIDTN